MPTPLLLREVADPVAFAAAVTPLLHELGVEGHALHLGVLGQVVDGNVDASRQLWRVEARGELVGCLLRTPPYPYTVALRGDASAVALASAVVGAGLPVGDVTGPGSVTGALAQCWAALVGGTARQVLGLHLLTCAEVVHPAVRPPGTWRRARLADAEVVETFVAAFLREALPDDAQDPDRRSRRVARRLEGHHGIHLWLDADGCPVSTAAIGMPAADTERIASVYTPPERRGRGYAGALVAALTQDALDRGRSFVHLSTDVTNPVSTAVYERIGYRRVGEQATWRVTASTRAAPQVASPTDPDVLTPSAVLDRPDV